MGISVTRRRPFFVPLILAAFIHHHGVVGHGFLGVAVIFRHVATAEFRFDVNPAGEAVVLKDFVPTGKVAEVQPVKMAMVQGAVHTGDIAMPAPPKQRHTLRLSVRLRAQNTACAAIACHAVAYQLRTADRGFIRCLRIFAEQ